MSLRSAPGSASITLLACSTSSSPSGYLRWISSLSPASSFSASATRSGSPEMRKTLPLCPIWTPNLCSISLRFSLRPPASVLAPSLSSSSSRAEGSPKLASSAPRACTPDLIKRRQQDKPLRGAMVVIRVRPGIAKILLRHQLPVHQRPQRRRVFSVLDAVQLERALQPHHLPAREHPRNRAA